MRRINRHPLSWYKPGRKVIANDTMSNVKYTLTASPGKDFDPSFSPELSPAQMLRMGVFEGKYINDCEGEFPKEWFAKSEKRRVDISSPTDNRPKPRLNQFGVKSRMSLQHWRKKGWIPIVKGDPDIRGWFQWYCRYWIGRRLPNVDKAQIKRWRAFTRHRGQILASYKRMKNPPISRKEKRKHRAKQRQALLQWAYNPYV